MSYAHFLQFLSRFLSVIQCITMYYILNFLYYNVLQCITKCITLYYSPFLGYVIQRITLYYIVLQWLIQQSDWEFCTLEMSKKKTEKYHLFFLFYVLDFYESVRYDVRVKRWILYDQYKRHKF